MRTRPAPLRGAWYPRDAAACDDLLDELAARRRVPVEVRPQARGGIVPHAGWVYSGAIADAVVRSLAAAAPDLVVVFGGHLPEGAPPTLLDADAFESPYGAVPVSRQAVEAVQPLAAFEVERADRFRRDNAVEVEVPLVARALPGAPILVVGVPPDERAGALGRRVAEAVAGLARRPVFLGSTDLTHYGPSYGFTPAGTGARAHAWAKDENDAEVVARMEALDAAGTIESAARRSNACCPGAAAAAIEAVRAVGARGAGRVLARTTSFEVEPRGATPVDFVGYCGIVW